MSSTELDGVPSSAALPKLRGLARQRVRRESPPTVQETTESTTVPGAPPMHFLAHGVCQLCGKAPGSDEVVQISGRTVCGACKPLAIQRIEEGGQLQNSYAEQFRIPYLRHERRLRLLGVLCITWGATLFLGFPVMPTPAGRLFAFLLGPLMFAMGIGLENLSSWSRKAYVVFAVLTVPAIPLLAILIHAPVVYLIYSKESSVVLSQAYHEVIYATPHVKRQGPMPTWVFVVLAILLAAGLGLLMVPQRP